MARTRNYACVRGVFPFCGIKNGTVTINSERNLSNVGTLILLIKNYFDECIMQSVNVSQSITNNRLQSLCNEIKETKLIRTTKFL